MKLIVATAVAGMFIGTALVNPGGVPVDLAAAHSPGQSSASTGAPAGQVMARNAAALEPGPGLSFGADAPAIGFARPTRQAELAVPFDGVLAEIEVREGEAVNAGRPVARLDDRVAAASMAAARLAAERRGAIEFAEQDLALQEQRLRRLTESGAATDFELEESRIRVAQAHANVLSAREDREQAARNLDFETARFEQHHVTAPFDGRIVRIFARRGEAIERREPLMLLVDLSSLDVDFNLPIDTWTTLEVGRWYGLEATVPGATEPVPVAAQLRTAEAYVDAATQTVRCVFEVPNADRRFPAGATMTINPQRPRLVSAPAGHDDPAPAGERSTRHTQVP